MAKGVEPEQKPHSEVSDLGLHCLQKVYLSKYLGFSWYTLKHLRKVLLMNILFVLRFYGPVNPMGSCRAWSVYLTTRLLGRLSPLSG